MSTIIRSFRLFSAFSPSKNTQLLQPASIPSHPVRLALSLAYKSHKPKGALEEMVMLEPDEDAP
jgi:hypothetical protein